MELPLSNNLRNLNPCILGLIASAEAMLREAELTYQRRQALAQSGAIALVRITSKLLA